MNAIPEDWIKDYVDTLIQAAQRLEPGGFRDAILSRADHALDLVTAWRASQHPTSESNNG